MTWTGEGELKFHKKCVDWNVSSYEGFQNELQMGVSGELARKVFGQGDNLV
jgi:hypothetical protein